MAISEARAASGPDFVPPGTGPRAKRLLYLIELSVLLAVVRVRLVRQGFERTVAWATALRKMHDGSEARMAETVEHARESAQHVFRWHPVANKCLEQSLLMCKFLARRGIKAELVIAVRKYPFESHAWVRWRELDLTEPPEVCADGVGLKEIARF